MNNFQLKTLLREYPVIVCSADEINIQRGQFIISNTDTSDGPGKHWVTFYFALKGPDNFFDSLGKNPEYYRVGFEDVLRRPYRMTYDEIQAPNSDTCGEYCVYYIMERFKGMTLDKIVKPFNVNERTKNDNYVLNYINENN